MKCYTVYAHIKSKYCTKAVKAINLLDSLTRGQTSEAGFPFYKGFLTLMLCSTRVKAHDR